MAEGAKCEQLEKIVIGKNNVKFFQAGVQLPHWKKEEPIDFLKKNIDVFAWNLTRPLGWIQTLFVTI